MLAGVVRLFAAAQDHVAVRVAAGADNGGMAGLVTDRKWCGWLAARMASTAIFRLPSVPFLKPTGQDRPEASSRCTWLSVVRAPMAPS